MPAQSPTLSPTLSAMVAGLRGSSSGMPASTLPTRSAPTSAALVKMPPPTRRNRARSEPPNPNPMRIADAVFWKSMMMTVAPSRPRPTVNMPATPPVRNATLSAPGQRAGAGRRRGADVAAHREAHADEPGEAREQAAGDERQGPEHPRLDEREAGRAAVEVERFDDLGRRHEHDDRQRDQDHRDRLELALQVGHRAFLDRRGDLDHRRRALVGGEDAPHEVEADGDREQRRRGGEEEPEPGLAVEGEFLVAAFSSQGDHGVPILWVLGRSVRTGPATGAEKLGQSRGRDSSESNLSANSAGPAPLTRGGTATRSPPCPCGTAGGP